MYIKIKFSQDELDILDHIPLSATSKKNRYIWSQICIEDELDILSLCHIPLSSTSKKIDIWLQFLHEDELDTLSLYHIHVPLSSTSKNQYEVGGSSYSVCRSLI